jgi:transposase
MGSMQRIEIGGDRRRQHGEAFRAEVVAASLVPGARVQDVARRHGICPSLVYRWRRTAATTDNSSALRLVPVRITEAAAVPARSAAAQPDVSAPRRPGLIDIELAGGVCVRVDEGVSPTALRRIISVLSG